MDNYECVAPEGCKLTFGPLSDGALDYVGRNLREADKLECSITVAYQYPPTWVLQESVRQSEEVWLARWDQEPVAIFGILSDGMVWMMGTDKINDIPVKTVVIASRIWIDTLKGRHKSLWNFVLRDNDLHVRWLKAMGFDFLREVEGPVGSTFIEFRQ